MDKDTQQYIQRALRKATIKWSGRRECLKRSRKQTHDGLFTKKGKPILKYHWQCSKCFKWFPNPSHLEVDHIVEIGPFTNWNEWIEKLFCGPENLQAICVRCHSLKTNAYNSTLTFKRKIKAVRP